MIIFGVIVGAIYYQMKTDENGIQNRSALSYCLISLSFLFSFLFHSYFESMFFLQ